MTKRQAILAILLAGCLIGAALDAAQAQPVRPVYTTTSKDGRLVGFDTNLPPISDLWKPRAALAYGVDSGRFRYQAGLTVATGLGLPVLDQRIGDPSLAIVDWPSSPILGREGQSGIEAGLSLGDVRATAFYGSLWGRGDHLDRQVGYVRLDSGTSFNLPYGVRAHTDSVMTFGALMDGSTPGATFQSKTGSVGLSLDGFSARVNYGSLTNAADLAGFEFTTGVPGLGGPLTGERYWRLTLRRTFEMYETAIPLPVPEGLPSMVPRELPLTLRGDVGVHVANADQKAQPDPETPDGSAEGSAAQQLMPSQDPDVEWTSEMGFSWSASVTLSAGGVSIRAELVVPQDGSTRFNVNF